MDNKQRASQILSKLQALYPNAETTLKNWDGVDWKLLFAVIMSAQTTDKQVNSVTKLLFQKYLTLEEFANAEPHELEQLIRPVGFYRTKARHLQQTAKKLISKHHGKVPLTIKELIKLPGVGRKTANVVTSVLLERNFGIAVDTHVSRLSQRLGLTENKTPEKIEKDLMKLYPDSKDWNKLSLLLIAYGRNICVSRNPKCDVCILKEICSAVRKETEA